MPFSYIYYSHQFAQKNGKIKIILSFTSQKFGLEKYKFWFRQNTKIIMFNSHVFKNKTDILYFFLPLFPLQNLSYAIDIRDLNMFS